LEGSILLTQIVKGNRSKVSLHFSNSKEINITQRVNISHGNFLVPGARVMRKNSPFRHKGMMGGKIIKIVKNNALIDWGRSQIWYEIHELCPLGEVDDSLFWKAEKNIFQAAARGRAAIMQDSNIVKTEARFVPNNISNINVRTSNLTTNKKDVFQVGDLVKPKDIYHQRGNDMGMVEFCTNDEKYIVRWESNGDNQIAGSFRTFEADELTLISRSAIL
jgi:hypothetical protein